MDVLNPQFKTDDGAALRIWRDAAKNNYLSETHGRPIFDEVIMLQIIAPGSKGSAPVFEVERTLNEISSHREPVYGTHYERYKKFIDAFKQNNGSDVSLSGTPLKEWPEVSTTMAASLQEARIFTVESLAALPDERLNIVGPDGRTWRTKAQAYLAQAENSAFATSMAAQLEQIMVDMADKDRQIEELKALVGKLAANATEAPAPVLAPLPEINLSAPAAPPPSAEADTVPVKRTKSAQPLV